MSRQILVINSGSSSIKFSSFELVANAPATDAPKLILKGQISGIGKTRGQFYVRNHHGESIDERSLQQDNHKLMYEYAFSFLEQWLDQHPLSKEIIAVGHRVVHGGTAFLAPVLVNEPILDQLEKLIPLAPLHQPHNLKAIRSIQRNHPKLLQVACFDTAFHHTQSPVVQSFAIPHRFTEKGIHRHGFHGLSYEYIASILPDYAGELADGRVIVAHLGNGASLCAMHKLRSVDSTMGFTALDGLTMGTRCGSLDPGVILYMIDQLGMSSAQISDVLYQQSGLLGVSGISNDMRELLASDDRKAKLAVDIFVFQIARHIAALASTLRGLDILVFTGGIGENEAVIRARVCHACAWLGTDIDTKANKNGEATLHTSDSSVSIYAIPTSEERMIAQHTLSTF